MNPQSINKLSLVKLALVFIAGMFIFNFVTDLIASSFKPDYFLRWDYLIYNIGLEGLGLFICAIGTAHLSRKLPDFNLKTVVLRIILFASLYVALALISTLLIYLIAVGTNLKFYNPNFKLFISGMKDSFIFLVTWMTLKYQNN